MYQLFKARTLVQLTSTCSPELENSGGKEERKEGREGRRKEEKKKRDFSDGSVVKMLCFQCRGCWFKLQLGNKDPICHKAVKPVPQLLSL